jgi:hypothetical protein
MYIRTLSWFAAENLPFDIPNCAESAVHYVTCPHKKLLWIQNLPALCPCDSRVGGWCGGHQGAETAQCERVSFLENRFLWLTAEYWATLQHSRHALSAWAARHISSTNQPTDWLTVRPLSLVTELVEIHIHSFIVYSFQ